MASRFPSIEEFDDGQTSPVLTPGASTLDLGLDDPTADFLSREKATLGADADLFATQNDSSLLGGDDDGATSGFESSFPSLETTQETGGPGGTITGGSEPYMPGHNAYTGMTHETEEEPEVVRQWRERQQLEIARRSEVSEKRKQETIARAQQDIDDFYENYNTKRDKAVQETRREAQEFLDNRENTVAGGTAWERIAKLVDLSDKGVKAGKSDKTQFRAMLMSLRKDEKAPGASGY
ncbi:hypothetical protein K440DRAFT_658375 [Wilcoxina mikolae CBS 423.85]|nr:hypothetical protein K440DRAFT_658375 [Wilcoxina mikolae CBS 423.85]